MLYLGKFDIKSGKAMVSDPCYTKGTWCQGELDKVKNGEWVANVEQSDEGMWGIRNSELIAYHNQYGMPSSWQWSRENFDIGVDSGQCGFYDLDFYRNDSMVGEIENRLHFDLNEDGERFYALNCDMTGGEMRADVMEFGTVSSSGYGDGGYTLYTVRDSDGLVVAMKVVFIEDEDTCEDCGEPESECDCAYCDYCNEKEQYCECEWCNECGEHEDDCDCEDEE
jgi:Protein of unknown function (DUF4241)